MTTRSLSHALRRGFVAAGVSMALALALAAGLAAPASAATSQTGPPRGSLDVVTVEPQGLTLSGWALDPDTTSSIPVHVYLDGAGVAVTTAGDARADIAAAFPGYGAAHGFRVVIGAAPGSHTVCVYGIDQVGSPLSNTTIGCRTVTVLGGDPIGRVDSIQVVPGTVILRGWALDPLGNSTVQLQLSGQVFNATDPEWDSYVAADLPRPDIAAAFPGYGGAHGFLVAGRIPAWGSREFSVHALVQENGTVTRRAPIYGYGAPGSGNWPAPFQIPPPSPFGSLDSAVQSGMQQVSVSGWAIDLDATTSQLVHVYVDGRFAAQVTASATRDDLVASLPFGTEHGYSATIPVTTGGSHTVCAYGINQNVGDNSLLGCRTVGVQAGSPIGSLDAATAAAPGVVTVAGWALDPDVGTPITVRLYTDGAYSAAVVASSPRPDVDAAFPLFGRDHGWSTSVADLAPGAHQVCAYGIDQGAPAAGNTTLGCRTVTVG